MKSFSSMIYYLKYSVLAFFLAFLPLANSRELIDSTLTSKSIVFHYGIAILLLLYALSLITSFKKSILKITSADLFLALLAGYIVLNRYLLSSSYSASLRFNDFLGLIILYAVLRQYKDRRELLGLLFSLILGGLIQAVYGNLQLYRVFVSNHSGFGLTGSFFNPGPYAGYLSSALSGAIAIYIFKSVLLSPKCRDLIGWLVAIVIICIVLVLPATASRAAWMSALAIVIFLTLQASETRKKFSFFLGSGRKKFQTLVVLTVCCIAFIVVIYLVKKPSGDGRLLVWRITGQLFATSPVTGTGFDRFKAFYMDQQALYFQLNPADKAAELADNVVYAYNEPLQFIIEEGLVGLLILSCIVWSVIGCIKNGRRRYFAVTGMSGLLAVFVFSLFSYPSQHLPIKLNAIFYLVLIVNNSEKHAFKFLIRSFHQRAALQLMSGAICLFLSYRTFVYSNKYYNGYEDWRTAQLTYDLNYPIAADMYKERYPVFENDPDFLMWYGKSLSMSGSHRQAIQVLNNAASGKNSTFIQTALGDSYKATGQLKKAEAAYWKAWYMSPGRFYPKYLLAKLYMETGKKNKARQLALELMNKKIKVSSQAIDQMKSEIKSYLVH